MSNGKIKLNDIIALLDAVIRAWIIILREDKIKGLLGFSLIHRSQALNLRFLIKLSREVTKSGKRISGTMNIKIDGFYEIKDSVVDKKFKIKKSYGKHIINLGYYLRSERKCNEETLLSLALKAKDRLGGVETIVPVPFLLDLGNRLNFFLNNIREDLAKLIGDIEFDLNRLQMRLTSHKIDITIEDIGVQLIQILIRNYMSASSWPRFQRELRRRTGMNIDDIRNIFEKWRDGIKELIHITETFLRMATLSINFKLENFYEKLTKDPCFLDFNANLIEIIKKMSSSMNLNIPNIYNVLKKMENLVLKYKDKSIGAEFNKIIRPYELHLDGILEHLGPISKQFKKISSEDLVRDYLNYLSVLPSLTKDDRIFLSIILCSNLSKEDLSLFCIRKIAEKFKESTGLNGEIARSILKILNEDENADKQIRALHRQLSLFIFSKELQRDTYRFLIPVGYFLLYMLYRKTGDNKRATEVKKTFKALVEELNLKKKNFRCLEILNKTLKIQVNKRKNQK
ncbi:MAG: hypothetical protein ACP6IQ_03000 [Candidatus Njordarchaeia archaeon]|nr:hypothetical protein [Candidatus Korarchaeota archaeon]